MIPRLLISILALVATASGATKQMASPSGGVLRLASGTSAEVTKRSVQLQSGTALISAGKRLVRRGKESISAGDLDITSSGTVMVAVSGANAKVTALEGTTTVRLANKRSQFTALEPGAMLLVERGSSWMPEPVEVDLQRLTRSSKLIAGHSPLPAQSGISKQIAKQQRAMQRGELLASNVTVNGSGGSTTVESGGSDGGQNNSNSGSSSSGGGGSSSSSGGGGSSSGGGGGGAVASGGGLAAAHCTA